MPRWYGSFNNRAMERDQSDYVPKVGDGATIVMYSDRHAATITKILSPSRIEIQRDKAIRTDENGMSDCQEYRFEPNPEGEKHIVTKRTDGRWKIHKNGTVVSLGRRDEHYDFTR